MLILVAVVVFQFAGALLRPVVAIKLTPGHEDLDQVFSIQASLIARNKFNTPEELMQIMDSAARPERPSEAMRKAQKTSAFKVDCECQKLDECAEWQTWVAMLGIRLKGLRRLDLLFANVWVF